MTPDPGHKLWISVESATTRLQIFVRRCPISVMSDENVKIVQSVQGANKVIPYNQSRHDSTRSSGTFSPRISMNSSIGIH